MTPGARLAAAIEVLDRALGGVPLEMALTGWARGSRYAGSKDRAAVRDLAYDAWRCRRSFAALGGADSGRGLILGGLRAAGADPADLMTGAGYAPPPPGAGEAGRPALAGAEAGDLPDWLWSLAVSDLGSGAADYAQCLRHRAPVFLRANLARCTREDAMAALAADGVETTAHPHVGSALEATVNARKVARSTAFLDGLVEVQDAASQDAVLALPLRDGQRVLDYCAGGGGKALAMAARARLDLWVHDAIPARLADVGPRAARAGVVVSPVPQAGPAGLAPFDLVLVDAPCSGSGTWRRDPEGKWRLTPERLAGLVAQQADILDAAAICVAPGGTLAYATCSVLAAESTGQARAFLLRNSGWRQITAHAWRPGPGGDGFSLAQFQRQ